MIRIGLAIVVALFSSLAFAQEHSKEAPGVPWDTLMAEIRTIEGTDVPDSTKNQAIRKLFEDRNVSIDQYRTFYDAFLKESLENQRRFIENVKTILQERIEQSQKRGVSSAEKPPVSKSLRDIKRNP